MSEMIDKVAMAIASELDEGTFYNSPAFQKAARAAIEAMREPAEGIIPQYAHPGFAKPLWQDMIDAAMFTGE